MIKEITTHFLPTFMPEEPKKETFPLHLKLGIVSSIHKRA